MTKLPCVVQVTDVPQSTLAEALTVHMKSKQIAVLFTSLHFLAVCAVR